MQTDVVYVVCGCAPRIHSTIGAPSFAMTRVFSPPGTRSTSGRPTSSKVLVISTRSMPSSSATMPARSAQNTTSAPGRLVNTWYGPMASRAAKPGYSPVAICIVVSLSFCYEARRPKCWR